METNVNFPIQTRFNNCYTELQVEEIKNILR